MNVIISFLFLVFSLSAKASENNSRSDEEDILKKIEVICRDALCEGTSDFWFKRLKFDPKNNYTIVFFELSPPESPLELESNDFFSSYIENKKFSLKCIIKGYSNKKDVLNIDGSVNDKFYEAFTNCALSLEIPIRSLDKRE